MEVEVFCNHFSLAMFSSQKETRYENQENRQKKATKQSRKPNQNLFQCFLFFVLLFKPFYYLLLFFPSILYLTRT